MFWVILIIVIIVLLWVKSAPPTKKPPTSPPQTSVSPSAPRATIDESIVDNVIFLYSVAISLAENHNPNWTDKRSINHGFIRFAADDYNGKSYLEFLASTNNISAGFDELRELRKNQTLTNAETFLRVAGFQHISVADFLRYIQLTKEWGSISGSFGVLYKPNIPPSTGKQYFNAVQKRLKEKYPYTSFEYDYSCGEIDLGI